MTTLTSLLPFLSSAPKAGAAGGGSAWSRLVGVMRRVVGRLGRRPSAAPPVSDEPTKRAITPPATASGTAVADAADAPARRTATRVLWGIEVAVTDEPAGLAEDARGAESGTSATAPATAARTDAAPRIVEPAIHAFADDYGLEKARSMAETAAQACREAAGSRTGFVSTTNPPVVVRKRLLKKQLQTAATLYENAALAMRVVEIALDRDYRGNRQWAISTAAMASSQLLDFLRTVVRQDCCSVQKAVYSALDAVTKDRGIYVAEGMTWKQSMPYGNFGRTSRWLELAAEGRTQHDAACDRLLRTLDYDLRQLDEDAAVDLPRMLGKIDTTVAALLDAPHRLSPRDPRLAAVAGLADEVDFDPATHPSIAAIADAEAPTEAERAADATAAARDTRTVGQVIDECNDRWAGKLAFALNSRSDRDYPYARPHEVERAFDWLATTYRDAMTDSRSVSHQDLHLSLREAAGWHFRPHQSATTVGRFREWYECSWNGSRRQVLSHIGRGDTKRMAGNAIRIGFTWDREHELIVIGFIGQHQRTTQS